MGTNTKFDKNRYRKIYRYIRKKPLIVNITGGEGLDVTIEAGEITFTNQNSKSYAFSKTFSSAPFVTANAFDSAGNQQANVNVFITAVTTSGFTVGTSANFTGKIHFHAILPN